jgi:hypothetical protein
MLPILIDKSIAEENHHGSGLCWYISGKQGRQLSVSLRAEIVGFTQSIVFIAVPCEIFADQGKKRKLRVKR